MAQMSSPEAPIDVAPKGGFGTFAGVFTPTLLTILGVIMYLRLGWVVGNAGFLGAAAMIVLAFTITGATGLSMASVTTNIRIGAGGAYSIIAKSLGIEVGGGVGIPLYLAQAIAVTMYIFGFREGWLWVFPDHPPLLVDVAVFAAVFAVALVSAAFAFRIQYAILAIIVASLVSVLAAALMGSMTEPLTLFGDYPGDPGQGFRGTDFWAVFAVFFPAATGIMAGANMSGELKDPRRSIPVGTMAAIVLSLIIYLALAYWLARSAPVDALVSNFTVMIDRAAWGPPVLAGLLGATFSSAMVSLVGAPRILQALGEHRLLPGSGWFVKRTRTGEPRNALLLTAVIVLLTLLLRDLNAVAPLITMFFLITYAMINVVVLVEKRLELTSFRPLLRVPLLVPALGAGGCLFAMFVIDPVFSVVALVVVVGMYVYLVRKALEAPFGDIRSGLFVAIATWGARRVMRMRGRGERTWRPTVLAAVRDPRRLRGSFLFLRDVVHPKGMLRLLGVTRPEADDELELRLDDLRHAFAEEGVFVRTSLVEAPSFREGVVGSMHALTDTFFRPNVLFLPLPETPSEEEDAAVFLAEAPRSRMGVLLLAEHPQAGMGRRRTINLWVPPRAPAWQMGPDMGLADLAVLTGYRIMQDWNASLRLLTAVEDPADREAAAAFLDRVANRARLPTGGAHIVLEGDLRGAFRQAPVADLNVVPLLEDYDIPTLRAIVDDVGAACVFARDSGDENALA